MLVFIIAVRSAQVASDWTSVQRMAKRTTRQCLDQVGGEARCILACHEPPFDPAEFGGKARILEMDYAPPTRESLKAGDHGDKWIKLHHALIEAGKLNPDHLMILDEDDLVSNRLAAHVAAHPEVDGWRFQNGFVYEQGTRFLLRRDNFDRLCGSSFISKVTPSSFPTSINNDPKDYEILKWGHTIIGDKMKAAGKKVASIPFPAAIYMVGTGENCTRSRVFGFFSKGQVLRRPWLLRPITKKTRNEFGLGI